MTAFHGNTRDGTMLKIPTTDQGEVPIEVRRDRNGPFGARHHDIGLRRRPEFRTALSATT